METIRNIFFACLLLQIVEYCMPDSTYRKYIKFYGGLVIIALIVTPVINMLSGTELIERLIGKFENEKTSISLRNDIEASEQKTIEKIVEPYENEIVSHVSGVVDDKGLEMKKCNVTFDVDSTSSTYGSILMIDVSVGRKYTSLSPDLDEDIPSQYKLQIKNIKTELCRFYNLSDANINVSMK